MNATRTLATAPASIDLANYREVLTVGNVLVGDILSRDLHLQVVTSVTRTAKTVEFRAENAEGTDGLYGTKIWISKHRSSTSVSKALGSFTHIYRKVVA